MSKREVKLAIQLPVAVFLVVRFRRLEMALEERLKREVNAILPFPLQMVF